MCGIFGYIGKKDNAADLVLAGLKLLEYRGYDSWGIAVKVGKKLTVEKHTGKIGDATVSLPKSSLGIGHTRWATHGGVTVANAHPHLDCTKTISVVHNGIIENFQDIKDELLKKGHTFLSETDTEIVPHLIEENLTLRHSGEESVRRLQNHEGDSGPIKIFRDFQGKQARMTKPGFASAVRDAFSRLQGMNAIVVAYSPSKEIIVAKTGSPLVIGIGKDELFIASDAAGIVGHTKKVIFLPDNTMAILGDRVKLLQLPAGKEIVAEITELHWKFEDTSKGDYKHFFIKEIHEEPRVVENIALNAGETTKQFAKLINHAFGTFMLACGSASYAGIGATYMFSKIAKKHVNFAIGSEFKYFEDFVTDKTLLVPISQSGESIDVIEPVTRMKREKGVKVAAIVNTLGSTLYRISDFRTLLECGQEKAVVATKSFTAMIAMLLLTVYTVAGKQKKGQELLLKAAENIKVILKDESIEKIKSVAKTLKNKEHIYIIGRGISYAAALEATLKLKEAAYMHAEAFPGGELKHGVIALIEKGTPVIVFAPNDETYDEIISNAQEVKARGAYIIGIGPKENNVFDVFLPTADIDEATLLPQVTVSHLLGYYVAIARNVEDPDKPRNLAKSVTVK